MINVSVVRVMRKPAEFVKLGVTGKMTKPAEFVKLGVTENRFRSALSAKRRTGKAGSSSAKQMMPARPTADRSHEYAKCIRQPSAIMPNINALTHSL